MTVRVEVVTPCSHGEFEPHEYWPHGAGGGARPPDMPPLGPCDGGSRRTFTEWPPEAIEAAVTALTDYCDTHDVWNDADMAGVMLAAAWGHITGDNK